MAPPIFRLRIPDRVNKVLRNLHPHLKKRILEGLAMTLSDPHPGKSLGDELQGLQCLRAGKFRIVYQITGAKIIEIAAIGPRKTIYAETYRLISSVKS